MADSRPGTTAPSTEQRDSSMTFADLGVPQRLVDVLAAQGITTPFPIQSATLPDSLAGRDVLGRGRTGSGKTYAFVLPLLARLSTSGTERRSKRPRALILAPTRELASQIEAAVAPLAAAFSMRTMTVFGGVGANPQINALKAGVDVLVACPGRLEDLMSGGHVSLDAIEITVLDEADRQDPARRPADAVLGHAGRWRRRDRQAVPQQSDHPQRGLGAVAGGQDVAPRIARSAR
jgi:superfamily II DNA/RNA helicase